MENLVELNKYKAELNQFRAESSTIQTNMNLSEGELNWDTIIDRIIQSIQNISDLKSNYYELLKVLSNNKAVLGISNLRSEDIDVHTYKRFKKWIHASLRTFIDVIVKAVEFSVTVIQRIRSLIRNENARTQQKWFKLRYKHLTIVQQYIQAGDFIRKYFRSICKGITDPSHEIITFNGSMTAKNAIASLMKLWTSHVKMFKNRQDYTEEQEIARIAFEEFTAMKSHIDDISYDPIITEVIIN